MKKALKILLPACGLLGCVLADSPARAYTQCQSTVEKIWAGDGGYLWIHLANGGAPVIAANDPNREAVLSMVITALTTSRQVVVRYAADGVDCATVGRQDFVGMYLL